ncbi:MAG TPA: DoxX family protein [Lacipirellula sp.]
MNAPEQPSNPKWMTWTGWTLTIALSLLLVFSGVMKIMGPPDVAKEFTRLGYPEGKSIGIAIAELGSTVLYVIPQTSVLGAILLTGYLGGATATHVRVEEGFAGPVIIGIFVWLGVYLRDRRLRELVPWRR